MTVRGGEEGPAVAPAKTRTTSETNEDSSASKQDQGNDQSSELQQLQQYIAEKQERLNRKLEIRAKNKSGESTRPDETYMKKLDSSIKKVTSYIKRLKTLTESQKDALAKEMLQLNLSKYLSEVAAAFLEAKLKMNDLPCALHLCSLMHQNYAEFSAILFEQWQRLLNLKRDDKVTNPSKMRVDLRFFAELITIGILGEKEALSLLGNQLTVLTTYDKEHANISIIANFCKHCGEDFADLVPTKYETLSSKYSLAIPANNLYSPDRQRAVKSLFREYYRTLVQHLLDENLEMQKLEHRNRKIYQTKGELHAEKKEKFELAMGNFKKLVENTEMLAELLGEQMVALPVDESLKKDDDLINIDVYSPSNNRMEEFDSTTSLWEDEDTRQFYEQIPDLKIFVPGLILKEAAAKSKAAGGQASATAPSSDETQATASKDEPSSDVVVVTGETGDIDAEMVSQMEKELQELEKQAALNDAADDQAGSGKDGVDLKEFESIVEDELAASILSGGGAEKTSLNSGPGDPSSSSAPTVVMSSLSNANLKALMDVFIAQLPNCVNRELIDKAAKEFCTTLNTKLNRKRLIGALFQVQRTRLDLLPFYSRLVATLNPCMPEIGTELCSLLHNDFRFHVRKKDQINIESKIKTARFIGELVKFKAFPGMDALNCLKTLLADFRHHNIEMACNLLDVCGRFLYRTQESHMKLKLLLEILMRKKQAMAMDSRYTIMIENAFYYCNPPENKQIEKAVRSPMHEYIKKLLYKDLNKLCVEKVLKQMRKINWKDSDLFLFAVRCLTAAWNVRYNSIHCLANLVSGLALYYEEVGVHVVDGVIEDIRVGLEINLFKFNQRRISMVKYLGELYNYRMVESVIIFKTLYTLITYGVAYDTNFDEQQNAESLDPANNFFRVRLVCALLDTCGQYFDRGAAKKKLDCFLVYFQRYYWYKRVTIQGGDKAKPFDPRDIEFAFTETVGNLRPNFKFSKSYEEASEGVAKMEEELREHIKKLAPQLLVGTAQGGGGSDDSSLHPIKEDEEMSHQEEDEMDYNEEDDEHDERSTGGLNKAERGEDEGEDEEIEEQDDTDEDADDYLPDDENKGQKKRKNPRASSNLDEDNMANEDESAAVSRNRYDSSSYDQQYADSNSEVEDSLSIKPVIVKPKEVSKEDDEFMKAFDSLLNENIAQRTKEQVKVPNIDIAIPVHLRKSRVAPEPSPSIAPYKELKGLQFGIKPAAQPEPATEEEAEKSTVNSKKTAFNFAVMIRKGNKPQLCNMEVPSGSEFASQFKAREEAERLEKEKLKQLTLNINQRIEQEEFQQELFLNSGNQRANYMFNTNRDRHQKYNHMKGAPDADLIFGTGSGNSSNAKK